MTHDNANERARQLPVPSQQQLESYVTGQRQVVASAVQGRGRPATLTRMHLCLSIVLCGLHGFGSQLKLWRQICLEPMGPFAPVWVVDQAVYNRLARAAGGMRAFFEQVSGWMAEQLEGLQQGTLLLFDRGYLSFPWFDSLTQRKLWWISRYANHASMQVRHILYQGDGVMDVIVWLGAYRRADRAKYPVRLVQFYHHGRLHRYLTNVLDPQQLSLAEIARLYARRWDIELAFCVLKEHLHLSQLWSAKWEVVQVQIWCGLLLAQVFHGLQVQLAAQEGVEPFDVSIELLVEVVPQLLQRGIAPLPVLGRLGRELGLIRPSSRLQVQVPFVDPSWITPAPPEALQSRETVRYAQRKCTPGPRSSLRKAG